MTLTFLTPAPGVLARSPLHDTLAAAGATFTAHEGWEVCTGFGDARHGQQAVGDAVTFSDASHLAKFDLRGGPFAPGRAEPAGDGVVCGYTRDRALWLGDGASSRPADADGLDVTTQHVALRLAGPAARETIARFCALDLRPAVAPPGSFLPGSVARTPAAILIEAPETFLLLLGAAYAAYAWDVVSDAGTHLGGRAAAAVLSGREGALRA